MSINPIINRVDAINNKSLNIIGNSATVNNLIASDNVLLKGNQIPASTTTAGFILQNTDGLGSLNWVDPNQNQLVIDSGLHTTNISNPVGLNNLNEGGNTSRYIRIGDVCTIYGWFRGDVISKNIQVTIDLIPNTTNSNINISLNSSGNGAKAGSQTLTSYDVTVSGNRATFYLYSVNDATIQPANMTNTVFHYVFNYINN
jgi:hypothetical protein